MKLKEFQKDILKEVPFWTFLSILTGVIGFIGGGWEGAWIMFLGFESLSLVILADSFFDEHSIGNMHWKRGLASLSPWSKQR